MKVAIIGSRERTDQDAVIAAVRNLPDGTIVVSGGCEGPDTWATHAARARGLAVVEHLPDLTGCKKRHEYTEAYYARNRAVVADCDRIIAFVSAARKGGTEYTIKQGLKAGKPIELM
ncbi:SLOG family protein [Shinella sp.]|uniref:SLOG family protein n=1 Tax=Shinella sp. TaxID=1870904 RepID=UPI003F72DF27